MRFCYYSVINKSTGKRIYANCRLEKVEDYLRNLHNSNDYFIDYKWKSL